jgi:glycosyltransferase involved in cell wall biosynthesis|tara:strand:- start:2211 stop:3161 length:951 start_codon:yes stop_codon:yes gene_type:complete
MQLSVIIPLFNEEDSLVELNKAIEKVISSMKIEFEIIFVDDGSNDNSWNVVKELSLNSKNLIGIKFSRNFGKSQALYAGFEAAAGEVIITMDADLQDDPNEIPFLYDKIEKENFDLVSGWKKKRFDSIIFKNFPSKIFNWAARKTSGIKLNDFNCGIKAYKKEVIKEIKLTDGMHRYIPVLANNAGFKNITEKVVKHHPRKHGKTKYGADRFIKGFLDLITLWFIHKFGKRPMHFFGLIGTIMLLIGFFFSLFLGIEKLFIETSGRLITDRPEFYISLATMIMGTQFFLAGFLGEIILKNKKIKKQYIISEKLLNE